MLIDKANIQEDYFKCDCPEEMVIIPNKCNTITAVCGGCNTIVDLDSTDLENVLCRGCEAVVCTSKGDYNNQAEWECPCNFNPVLEITPDGVKCEGEWPC